MSTKGRAFIYTRISQDRSGAGHGVERQHEACLEIAQRWNLEVLGEFEDNDRSAYSGVRRQGYEGMLSRLSEVDYIVSWDTDRLYRSLTDYSALMEHCREHGVALLPVTGEVIDPSSPSGKLVATVMAGIAEYESAHRGDRIAAKARQTIAQGRHPGGNRPFGFDLVERGEDERRQKLGSLYALNDREAEALRQAAEDILERGRTLGSICREWNDPQRPDGRLTTVPTKAKPEGGEWRPTPLRNALLRPRNAGRLYAGDELVAELPELAIFSPDTLRALERHFDRRRKTAGRFETVERTNRARHLLAGVIRCHCGALAVTRHLGGRAASGGLGTEQPQRAYRCVERGPGHASKRLDYAEAVVKFAVNAWFIHEYLYRLEISEEDEALLAELDAQLTELRRKRENFMDEAGAEGWTLAEMRPYLKANEDKRAQVQAERDKVAGRSRTVMEPKPGADRETTRMLLGNEAYRDFLTWPLDDQREFIRDTFDVEMLPSDPAAPKRFDPDTVQVTMRKGLRPDEVPRNEDGSYAIGAMVEGSRISPLSAPSPGLTEREAFRERVERFDHVVTYLRGQAARVGLPI